MQSIQGTNGNQSMQGKQGTQGRQGTQGTIGTQGIQGTQGTNGTQGIQGKQGTQGRQGTQGTQGRQGTQGTIGTQGIQGTQGTIGTQGIQGTQGTQGRQGTQGTQGRQGIQGTIGTQGDKGGLLYGFEGNTTEADPGSGDFRLNNATISSVDELYINQTTDDGANVGDYILTWDDLGTSSNRGTLIIKSNTNSDNTYAIFKVNGSITDNTTWFKVELTYVAGTKPDAGEKCVIEFIPAGIQAVQGIQVT